MKVSSSTSLVMPIMGNRNIWLPEFVRLNEQASSDLQLDAKGNLWIHVEKGIHDIHLKGSVKGRNQLMLTSLLPLHNSVFFTLVYVGMLRQRLSF